VESFDPTGTRTPTFRSSSPLAVPIVLPQILFYLKREKSFTKRFSTFCSMLERMFGCAKMKILQIKYGSYIESIYSIYVIQMYFLIVRKVGKLKSLRKVLANTNIKINANWILLIFAVNPFRMSDSPLSSENSSIKINKTVETVSIPVALCELETGLSHQETKYIQNVWEENPDVNIFS
jgi:hypothetical protein